MNREYNQEENYKIELSSLAQGTWSLSPTSKKRPTMPPWFDNVVSKRGEGMLSLLFYANYPWIVFPEFVPGYCAVAFHKTPDFKNPMKPKKLQLRYFQGIEALDTDMLIQRSVAVLCKRWLNKTDGMIKLEDDNILTFVFSSRILTDVLMALGMPRDEMVNKRYIQEKNIRWDSIGL